MRYEVDQDQSKEYRNRISNAKIAYLTFSSISIIVCFPMVRITSKSPSICDQLITFDKSSDEFLFGKLIQKNVDFYRFTDVWK
jgi:hypothetical protein